MRKLTGIGFPGVPITEKFLLADVHADWPMDRAGGHGWPHKDGPLFAMPMLDVGGGADNLWRLMAYDPASSHALTESEIVERLGQLVAERTGGITIRIHDTVWASSFRAHRRLAQHYRMGRVFLSGDAAHIHSPLGGQGMVTGMGDAENLAWKLALVVSGEATEMLLDTYESERRPVATEVLLGTTTATRLQVGKGPLMRFLRNKVLAPIAKLPSVQRRASLIASQLWVTYRNGPLGSGRGRWPGPGRRAGDRVPDMACRRASGSATRLHAELGGRWALLLPADFTDDFAVETRDKLGDGAVTLTTDGNEVLLVRPDAHLAWCGRDPSGLGRWLGRVLQRGTARVSNVHPLHS